MRMIRNVLGGACALALLGVGFGGDTSLKTIVGIARAQTAKPAPAAPPQAGGPRLQVDPLWPKPLPNHWLFGSITGVAVDSQNHIWVVHRGADSLNARTEMSAATNPPTADECCHPAPAGTRVR